MNKEDNFINTLFDKTEETEAVKPQTTEIVNMSVGKIMWMTDLREQISTDPISSE